MSVEYEDFRVSVSQLKKFKSCPRSWQLAYTQGLKQRFEERSPALAKGTALHRGIEFIHGGRSLEDALIEVDKLSEVPAFSFGGAPVLGASSGDTFAKAWARAVLRAYDAYERVRTDENIGLLSHPEFAFGFAADRGVPNDTDVDVVLGHYKGKRILLMGKVDGWDETRKEVFEHKTARSLSAITAEDLVLDDQVSAMLFAMSHISGEPVLTAVYNVIQKPQMKYRPKVPKSLQNETPEQYEYRLTMHMLASPAKYFGRMTVCRTEAALANWQEDAISVVRCMIDGIDFPALRASWGGPCHWCAFRPLCQEWANPTRRASIRNSTFSTREQRIAEAAAPEPADFFAGDLNV